MSCCRDSDHKQEYGRESDLIILTTHGASMGKNKQWLMMAGCLVVPIGLLVAVYGFGIKSNAIYWIALIMCPLAHLIMMKMHGDKKCH